MQRAIQPCPKPILEEMEPHLRSAVAYSVSMKRREFIKSSVAGSLGATLASHSLGATPLDGGLQPRAAATRKILIAGGNYNTAFIRYAAELTGKPRPKLLYLPTASADSPTGIIGWYRAC